jgi:hypothetical protein
MLIPTAKQNKDQSTADDLFATGVKARENWICQICGSGYKVCCHHIIPREIKEFRYCEDNAITLCLSHHKFNRHISAHNAPFAFFLWLQRFRPSLFLAAVERISAILTKQGININTGINTYQNGL